MGIDREYNAAVDFVDRHVSEGRGNKAAFVDPSREISYAELSNAAARIGAVLARLGVERENRILLILHDTVSFPILFWGAIRAGIIPVLINTILTSDQYRYLLEDTRGKVAFVSPSVLPSVQSAAKGVATLKHIVVVGEGPDRLMRLDTLLATQRDVTLPAVELEFPKLKIDVLMVVSMVEHKARQSVDEWLAAQPAMA